MSGNSSNVAVLALGACLALVVAFLTYVFSRLRKIERDYSSLTRRAAGHNILEIVSENIEKTDILTREVYHLSDTYGAVLKRMAGALQHVGVVRYDAFRDIGGRMSFSVALLDERGNGLVLSSIYGRTESRTYAKPVVERDSAYELSPEEREAIRLAMQSREMGALPMVARDREHEERLRALRLFEERTGYTRGGRLEASRRDRGGEAGAEGVFDLEALEREAGTACESGATEREAYNSEGRHPREMVGRGRKRPPGLDTPVERLRGARARKDAEDV